MPRAIAANVDNIRCRRHRCRRCRRRMMAWQQRRRRRWRRATTSIQLNSHENSNLFAHFVIFRLFYFHLVCVCARAFHARRASPFHLWCFGCRNPWCSADCYARLVENKCAREFRFVSNIRRSTARAHVTRFHSFHLWRTDERRRASSDVDAENDIRINVKTNVCVCLCATFAHIFLHCASWRLLQLHYLQRNLHDFLCPRDVYRSRRWPKKRELGNG